MGDQKPLSKQSGGVNVAGDSVTVAGDVVGGNKFIQNIAAVTVEKVTALHQLPPPTADFTGRAGELAELLEAIKTQGVAITGMRGMGGVGKTALALKLADGLKQDYPDGQIYLDLKGVDQSALTPKDAMAHVIRSFDLTAKPPESEAEVIALYRSVLHNKKALLLMDNAKDEQQVKPLIPPDGSLLIITSRQHFTLPGLFDKNLDALLPKDAFDLLCRIAPRLKKEKKETIEELARLCGFLPLALETVANALKIKTYIDPSEYGRRLKDARERLKLTQVEASLELSYQLLPKALQEQFRNLAIFPDTFDAAAAAAIWKVEPNIAQDALGELLLYSLVEFNQVTRRYRLHDLVRLFADERPSPTEPEVPRQRHAEHYLKVLDTANELYLAGGESVLKGLALFDLEWSNIRQGQSWAASRAVNDKIAADWCSAYPGRGAHLLSLRQHPRERIQWLEAALTAARRLKNRQNEAAALTNVGLAYYDLGEYRRAIEYHEQRLQIARETGARQGEGRALGNLGIAYYFLGEHRRAIEYHEQQLKIAREIRDRLSEGAALGNLGIAYYSLGEYRRAIEYHEQRLQIAREIGDRHGEGQALGNLGLAYHSLGAYRRAIEYQEQRLKIAREMGDRLGEGQALGNLGPAYHSLGEYRRAIEYQEQRLKIAREMGDRLGEGQALGNLGIAYRLLGEYRRAIEYYEQRLQIARAIGDRRGEGDGLWNVSLALDALGDRAQAVGCAEAALRIYEAIESPYAARVRDQLAKWQEEAHGKAAK